MARIQLVHVAHAYPAKNGSTTYALQPHDLVFEDGRSYALLGPSGCGKTTMLNIISGLVTPSEGRVLLDGADVTGVGTAQRNIAQVFQFPVIYQSKTVFENLAFPLRCRRWSKPRIRRRVEEIAAILDLEARLGRPARSLTADEKQLISLGRGLVRDDVRALLMDEPLTVIDPQMKFHLRRKLKAVNETARLTVIYVTHDQNEAMTFAQTILVMNAGRVVQSGTPEQLFEQPESTYVGTFIGSPGMNFIDVEDKDGSLYLGGIRLPEGLRPPAAAAGHGLQLGIRPEHLALVEPNTADAVLATIIGVQDQGNTQVLDVAIGTAHAFLKVSRSQRVEARTVSVRFPPERTLYYRRGKLVA